MKHKLTQYILILFIIPLLVGCSNGFVYTSAKNQSDCSSKGGAWYKSKCWKEFDDDGISKSDVDSLAEAKIKIINKSVITIDNQTHPLVAFLPYDEDEEIFLITVYGKKDNYKTILIATDEKAVKKDSFEAPALLFNGDMLGGTNDDKASLRGKATVKINDFDNVDIDIKGTLENEDKSKAINFNFKTNETITGAGNSHLEIKGDEAYLSGDLGTITYVQIRDMIKNHPNVKTIVMTKISGSVNDAFNMHTGRLVHENGLTTKVLSDSDIASGGVDLFCAGTKRIVEKGAKLGIHSWCCVNDLTAIEIPKDHPAHKYQIAFFTMALGKEKGPAFYFHTLEAAAFDSISYMSDDAIKKWTIATEFVEN